MQPSRLLPRIGLVRKPRFRTNPYPAVRSLLVGCRLAIVPRQQCVVQNEAGDVVSECEPGEMVDPRVLAGVDAAQACLLRGGAEARERARYARERGRRDGEALIVPEEGREHV